MDSAAARATDPLDWEIVERAAVRLSDVIKAGLRPDHIRSDVELQQTLRSELAEMVCSSCVSDTAGHCQNCSGLSDNARGSLVFSTLNWVGGKWSAADLIQPSSLNPHSTRQRSSKWEITR